MDNYLGDCYKCDGDLFDDFGTIVCIGCMQEPADCDCDTNE